MSISNTFLYPGLNNNFLLVAIGVVSSFLAVAYNADTIHGAVGVCFLSVHIFGIYYLKYGWQIDYFLESCQQ